MMKTSRADVYSAIDSERDYQDARWNADTTSTAGQHSVGEFLGFIGYYLGLANATISTNGEPEASYKTLHVIRKVAGLGVACMEQNGAITRSGSVGYTGKTDRPNVYGVIDTERDYQDGLWPQDGRPGASNPLSVGEFLLMLDEYFARARSEWTSEKTPELKTLGMIRKIVGIAVNCMEQHGAPRRYA